MMWRASTYTLGSASSCARRCLGDHDLKAQGLTADPEVTCRDLSAEDQFIVVATDGLWDKCDNSEAVNIVHDTGRGLARSLIAPMPIPSARCSLCRLRQRQATASWASHLAHRPSSGACAQSGLRACVAGVCAC